MIPFLQLDLQPHGRLQVQVRHFTEKDGKKLFLCYVLVYFIETLNPQNNSLQISCFVLVFLLERTEVVKTSFSTTSIDLIHSLLNGKQERPYFCPQNLYGFYCQDAGTTSLYSLEITTFDYISRLFQLALRCGELTVQSQQQKYQNNVHIALRSLIFAVNVEPVFDHRA